MRNLIRLFAFLDEQLQAVGSAADDNEDDDSDRDSDRQSAAAAAAHQPEPREGRTTTAGARELECPQSGVILRQQRQQPSSRLLTESGRLASGVREHEHELLAAGARELLETRAQVRLNLFQSVSFVCHGERPISGKSNWGPVIQTPSERELQLRGGADRGGEEEEEETQANQINLTKRRAWHRQRSSSSSSVVSIEHQTREGEGEGEGEEERKEEERGDKEDEGWILLEQRDVIESAPSDSSCCSDLFVFGDTDAADCQHEDTQIPTPTEQDLSFSSPTKTSRQTSARQQLDSDNKRKMSLEESDIQLVRASWAPARDDPVGAGVQLFKGLFTKFPLYLDFFPQFVDLNLDDMHENKRLLRHAVKVIETVTFVVDAVGDETKAGQLNAALLGLVRGHLKRQIGLAEFRNLGIVIIDFVCALNSQRVGATKCKARARDESNPSTEIQPTATTTTIPQDQDTTGAPTGRRRQSLSSRNSLIQNDNDDADDDSKSSQISSSSPGRRDVVGSVASAAAARAEQSIKLDTSLLVAAWTKFYTIILDLVKREEEEAEAAAGCGQDGAGAGQH